MRGAPQSGLARLISRISRRISGVTLGLPARRRDFQRQKERKPARCHRITTSGLTIVRASRIRGGFDTSRRGSSIELAEDRALR